MNRSLQNLVYTLIFLLLACITISAQNKPPEPPKAKLNTDEEIFIWLEDMPSFHGCNHMREESEACTERKLMEFFQRNLRFPKKAIQQRITGTVRATFVIEKDGRTTNAKIIKGISKECNKEVLRVINLMNAYAHWNPIRSNRRPVRVLRGIEIDFLNTKEEISFKLIPSKYLINKDDSKN